MNYPVSCNNCSKPLYGPVKYCPFCGGASVSVVATDDKQKLDSLSSEISSSLSKGEYTPDIRGGIRQKGKEIGITETVADSLLLAVLKEKGFSPVKDGANDSLEVEWCTAEKKPKEVTPQQPETTTTEEPQPKPEKPVEPKPSISTPTERIKKTDPRTPPKPLFWKVIAGIAIVGVAAGLFYTKKGPSSVPKTEQREIKPQSKVEQPKETKREVVEPPKPLIEERDRQQPPAVPNLNEEREKIKQEAEREALAKIETARQRQEQINREKEAERQRQEQGVRQQEIDEYLSEGKLFFEKGKYDVCIEKLREVLKRDRQNHEALYYTKMSMDRKKKINEDFKVKTVIGGSE